MKRLVLLVAALAAVIYVRSTIPENIHPWQLLWVVWVGSTCGVAGCIGWVAREITGGRKG